MTRLPTTNSGTRKDDHAAFKRLAVKRVNRAEKYIRLIANLSNRSNYHYTAQDVKKIFTALESELNEARTRFDKLETKLFTLE